MEGINFIPTWLSPPCGLLGHQSRGWALPERWVYTISWNRDDEDQPMVRVEGYKEGVPATRVSRWVVRSSPGNVSHGGRSSGQIPRVTHSASVSRDLEKNTPLKYPDLALNSHLYPLLSPCARAITLYGD
uniref:(California timema) hypothetical protein n=1 Tax=Timema californicum TaxID=61474 RepID=A0A7R9JF50_TIMCA|nr:unnamed protein product [Timema californicum]